MLKFLHEGFLLGVPARDLTDDEAKIYGKKRLLDSKLYVEVKERKPRKEKEIEAPADEPQAEE